MAETKIVGYKGRAYRLLWTGKTKFGDRAKLGFLDGSKEFWVSLDLLEAAPSSKGTGRAVCAECGRPGTLIEDMEDGLMKHYRCCDMPSD